MSKHRSQGPRNPRSAGPGNSGGRPSSGFQRPGFQRDRPQREGAPRDGAPKDRPHKGGDAPARQRTDQPGADRSKFKPHGSKPFGNKERGKPHGGRPQSERAQSERAHAERPRGDRAPAERMPAERARTERPPTKLPLTASSPSRSHSPRPDAAQKPREPKAENYSARPRPAPQSAAVQSEPRETPGGRKGRANETWIYGHHPVTAVLANIERKILRVLATTEALAKLGEESSIPPRTLGQVKAASRRDIDDLVGEGAVHQGVAVLTHALDYDLQDVLERIAVNPESCIVVLDQVTDPHNVGAILRSAAAFGAAAVIAPDRHAPDESGAMAKSASGALDKIPYIKAGNLVRALELIKEYQFWLVGLDAEAPQQLSSVKLDGRIALVLGAEGEGLRRLVRETCDHVASLPMAGNMESLNVSNAAAVALYERARQTSTKR